MIEWTLSRLASLTRVPRVYRLVQFLLTDQRTSKTVILQGLQYAEGLRVLDLGCGPGTFAGLFRDEDYLGIDIAGEYIDRAREIHPRKAFQLSTAADLRSDRRFDRVLVVGVFHHMSDDHVQATLGAVRSLLAPGGSCFVAEAMWPEKRRDLAGWFLRKLDRGRYVRSYARWVELFEPFGLRRPGTYYNRMLPCMTCRLDFASSSPLPANDAD